MIKEISLYIVQIKHHKGSQTKQILLVSAIYIYAQNLEKQISGPNRMA